MLKTCAEYAADHNLKFSTDPNPDKCKTKLMAFLRKPRVLPNLSLCGTPLPWVNKIKHLGNMVSNVIDGGQLDMKVKNAKYVDKNNTLCQEFFFSHPQSKLKINTIYNSHFTGSQLWKFGSREMEKLESTFNKSIKIMFGLPWATHRYLMEPLTGQQHVRKILVKRYLSFIQKILNSKKSALVSLLNIVKTDSRTTTGSNLRWIMLEASKVNIEELLEKNIEIKYHEITDENVWKIDFIKEIVNLKEDWLTLHGFGKTQLDEILEHLCTG